MVGLKRSPLLRDLHISWSGTTSCETGSISSTPGLEMLRGLTNLEQLCIDEDNTTGFRVPLLRGVLFSRRAVASSLERIPLRDLSLAGSSFLHDHSLELLEGLAGSLTSLCLTACKGLTGKGFGAIARLSKLVCLDASECATAHRLRACVQWASLPCAAVYHAKSGAGAPT